MSGLNGITGFQLFWWVILPYLAMATFVIGHVWRYRYDQFGWTSRSTQLQEKGWLKWGSPIFHYGAFAAIAGHVIGILIPERWTADLGIPENAYRWFSAGAGTLAAVLIVIGVAILAGRRLLIHPRAGNHQPGRLVGAHSARHRDRDGHRRDRRGRSARRRLRLPLERGVVVSRVVRRESRRARHRARALPLSTPRHRGVGNHCGVAIQSARARVELSGVVLVAPVRRLSQPSGDSSQ